MDTIDRSIRQQGRRGGGGSNAALTTLAKESFDILTLLPNYIESTKTAVSELKQDTQVSFSSCQQNLIKTFQIEGMIALITKMTLIFSSDFLNGQK